MKRSFLNFPVHTQFSWIRFPPFPFYANAFYYMPLTFIKGNHLEKSNHLRWDCITLNLPSSKNLNPALPLVMKWNELIGNIAANIVAIVDDLRLSGVDEETAWTVV